MKILHTDIDRKVAFVAVLASDGRTRMVSISGVTVYWSLDGTVEAQMTTPTTAAQGANMVGAFWLDIDEAAMVALATGVDHAELTVHIEATNMEPITRAIDINRFSPADDQKLNTATTPWQIECKREGTATVLVAKKLRDKDDTDVTRLGITIGSMLTT